MKHKAKHGEFKWGAEPFALEAELATDHGAAMRRETERARAVLETEERQGRFCLGCGIPETVGDIGHGVRLRSLSPRGYCVACLQDPLALGRAVQAMSQRAKGGAE